MIGLESRISDSKFRSVSVLLLYFVSFAFTWEFQFSFHPAQMLIYTTWRTVHTSNSSKT